MNIILIDSGVEQTYSRDIIEMATYNSSTKNFEPSSNKNFSDNSTSHGTGSVITMKVVNPEIKIFLIKIFEKNNCTSKMVLLQALEYCKHLEPKIVNLAVSLPYDKSIHDKLKELYEMGKIIICSVQNGYKTSFPAKLPFVIGVVGEEYFSNKRGFVKIGGEIQCRTSKIPIIHNSIFGGNSKATAIVSSILSKMEILNFNDALIQIDEYFKHQPENIIMKKLYEIFFESINLNLTESYDIKNFSDYISEFHIDLIESFKKVEADFNINILSDKEALNKISSLKDIYYRINEK